MNPAAADQGATTEQPHRRTALAGPLTSRPHRRPGRSPTGPITVPTVHLPAPSPSLAGALGLLSVAQAPAPGYAFFAASSRRCAEEAWARAVARAPRSASA
jgi:hypothetical protein